VRWLAAAFALSAPLAALRAHSVHRIRFGWHCGMTRGLDMATNSEMV